jgi:hypothetical protein
MDRALTVIVDGRAFDAHQVDGHIDCPCWFTGKFKQVPCPWHDGMAEFPRGAFEASQQSHTTNIGGA